MSLTAEPECDLVMVALAGVQRFIGEARSTADLQAGSAIMSELAAEMIKVADGAGADVVMPSTAAEKSTPNRVVVRAAAGQGHLLAGEMAKAARQAWRAHELSPWKAGADATELAPPTPGFPDPQWVVVPPSADGYTRQWKLAVAALAARKHLRDFTFPPADQVMLCSLTGRWSAVPKAPPGTWNVRENESLSVAGHARRKISRNARHAFSLSRALAPGRECRGWRRPVCQEGCGELRSDLLPGWRLVDRRIFGKFAGPGRLAPCGPSGRAAGSVAARHANCRSAGGAARYRGRRAARGAYRRPCRIRALAGLPGRVTPMYLRTAFVHPGAERAGCAGLIPHRARGHGKRAGPLALVTEARSALPGTPRGTGSSSQIAEI